MVVGDQAVLFHQVEAYLQRLAISKDFLRGGVCGRAGLRCLAEELVVRGDDVFDRRGILRLLDSQRADEDALIGNRRGNTLELGKLARCLGELPQNAGRLEVLWIERRQAERLNSSFPLLVV